MKKLRLYLDTSVIGGFFDEEFYYETQILFESIFSDEFEVIISGITENELLSAPDKVRELLNKIPKSSIIKVSLSEECLHLADSYIAEGVVGKTSRNDCLHIALATINNADILVSWNFKHIVNVMRIRGYNAVNLINGYKAIDIRSPKEIIGYEKEK
ncbi:MAG: PIN domain-containing protein [Candidatus Kapabacteria bacterium]|nr:PIN domain-containing protein [Ignavibacteriota bacterium]MCW5884102.1 PIN domain-containing protein [Candidatus Kapabacteria bacterium]